jgi:hypothetical protein
VRFLAPGGGNTIFLTDDEAVLTLRKSQPGQLGMTRLGKFGLPGRFGPVDVRAGRWPSLGDDLKSLWRGLIPDLGQLVPDPNAGKGARAGGPESQPPQVMRMRLVGGNAKARVVALDELPGRSNYFIGNDPKKWRTNVPSYGRVKYDGVYPGVDLVYYGNQRQLEYDFVVAPGADPNQIKLSFAGADGMRVDAASGDLVLKLGPDEVRFHKPTVSQPAVTAISSSPSNPVAAVYDRRRRSKSAATAELDGAFVVATNNEVAFRVAGYDPKRALVIDPVLSYSTYLGGSYYNNGNGIAVDSSGNAYVTGSTNATDFPTANPLQANNGEVPPGPLGYTSNAFVAKLNAEGSALVYSTYLGGSVADVGWGIAVDPSGNAYVTGNATSPNFPTVNPLQATNHGAYGNAFVAELNSAGSALVYSTYLGGSEGDYGNGIAVDSSGNAYVTGITGSIDFPTANPIQANCGGSCSRVDAFVAELHAGGLALVYSTYLGGSNADGGLGIAVDSSGNAYVTGYTESTDFPTANPLQATNHGSPNGPLNNFNNAFVAKLNAGGSALVYSTYLGGSVFDRGEGIAADSSGNAYVTGYTESTDFPTANPLQGSNAGGTCGTAPDTYTCPNVFVTKLNPSGSALLYSTYLGGTGGDSGQGIAVDSSRNAYVTGQTSSTDFPTANPLQATNPGAYGSAFVAELNSAGSALTYSTYLGGSEGDYGYGIAVDSSGNAYVTGTTDSLDFPTVNSLQSTNHGWQNAFVTKISPDNLPAVSLIPSTLPFPKQAVETTSSAQTVTLANVGSAALTISSIVASGDFTQTNTCDTGIAGGTSCTVSVTFTPTASGNRTGTLSINDDAAGSPQTVALTGTGEVFTLAAASGSSTSAAVLPGQVATYTLSVAAEGGFNQSLTFTCTGAPSEATCTVSPNPVTPGSSATNITVSVTTTAPSVSGPRPRALPPVPPLSPGLGGLLMLALVLAAMAWALGRLKQPGVSRWQFGMTLFASVLLLTLALAGCHSGGTTPDLGTPAGTYTLTVTATPGSGSSALSQSVTLTLNVSLPYASGSTLEPRARPMVRQS